MIIDVLQHDTSEILDDRLETALEYAGEVFDSEKEWDQLDLQQKIEFALDLCKFGTEDLSEYRKIDDYMTCNLLPHNLSAEDCVANNITILENSPTQVVSRRKTGKGQWLPKNVSSEIKGINWGAPPCKIIRS